MLPNLEVDVNGHGIFFVNKCPKSVHRGLIIYKYLSEHKSGLQKELMEMFSGRLRRLFSKSAVKNSGRLKVMFDDFPGGANGFEMIVMFCYNSGRIDITPSNALLLHFAAKFMEINEEQTLRCLENKNWSWFELLDCLKQSQDLLPSFRSSYMLRNILDSLVEKISMISTSSPCSFSGSLSNRISSSTNSSRSSSFHNISWLQDLEFLNIHIFEKVVKSMISNKLDCGTICSFLVYYQKRKFILLSSAEKSKLIGFVVNFLSSLDESFKFPFRSLCDMIQVSRNVRVDIRCTKKLERMIGSRLDQATLDDLLIPCPSKRGCAYDVGLVLKFIKEFLSENRNRFFWRRLKKVGFLIDSYLREVSPDPCIKPHIFLALASALPNVARNSHDMLYEAIDMYFEVCEHIAEEQKFEICSVLNFDKLSPGTLLHLAKNTKFPVCETSHVLVCLQPKLGNTIGLRRNSSVSGNQDERLIIHTKNGKETANIVPTTNVTCPLKSKSLPRLCS